MGIWGSKLGGGMPANDGGGIPTGMEGGGILVFRDGGKPIGGGGKRASRACGRVGGLIEVPMTGGGKLGGGMLMPPAVGGGRFIGGLSPPNRPVATCGKAGGGTLMFATFGRAGGGPKMEV